MSLLTGKKIIVTGGTRGIGKSIVELLLQEGASVAFTHTGSPDEKTSQWLQNIESNPKAKALEKDVPTSKAVLVKGSDFEPYDLFEIELKKPEKKGFGVQVAVLSTQEALFKKLGDLQEDWFSSILVSVQKNAKKEQEE